jgi:hypothetical protein
LRDRGLLSNLALGFRPRKASATITLNAEIILDAAKLYAVRSVILSWVATSEIVTPSVTDWTIGKNVQ